MNIEREESFIMQFTRRELEILYHFCSHAASNSQIGINQEEDSVVGDFIECVYEKLYP